MQTDGTISIFTNWLGWYLNNVIQLGITDTGLVYLPIVWTIFMHMVEARSQGSAMSNNPDSVLAALEVKIVTIFLVLLVSTPLVYSRAIGPTTFQYTERESVLDSVGGTRTSANTDSNLDDENFRNTFIKGEEGVRIPIWWYLVMQVSNGIKYGLIGTIESTGNSYREVRALAELATVTDPYLRSLVNDFYSYCYVPALSKLKKDPDPPQDSVPGSDFEGPDFNWIGSYSFYNSPGYYDSIRVGHIVEGFPYDEQIDTTYASDPGAGAPLCTDYWKQKIQPAIVEQSKADGFYEAAVNASSVLPSFVNNFVGGGPKPEEIARLYLEKTPMKTSYLGDDLAMLQSGGEGGWLKQGFQGAVSAYQGWNLLKVAASIDLGLQIFIQSLVIGQSFVLLVIWMTLPIAQLVSGYSLEFLAKGALLILAVSFAPVLWALCALMDNAIAQMIWKDQNLLEILIAGGAGEANKRLLLTIAIGFLYLISTSIFGIVMVAAGSTLGHSIGGLGSAYSAGVTGASVTAMGTPHASGYAAMAGAAKGATRGALRGGRALIGRIRG